MTNITLTNVLVPLLEGYCSSLCNSPLSMLLHLHLCDPCLALHQYFFGMYQLFAVF